MLLKLNRAGFRFRQSSVKMFQASFWAPQRCAFTDCPVSRLQALVNGAAKTKYRIGFRKRLRRSGNDNTHFIANFKQITKKQIQQWRLPNHFLAVSLWHHRTLFARSAPADLHQRQETRLGDGRGGPPDVFDRITWMLVCSLHTENYVFCTSPYNISPAHNTCHCGVKWDSFKCRAL